MYPLNAILIGRDERILPGIRRELLNQSVHLEAECREAASAVELFRKTRGDKRLAVFLATSNAELEELARLTAVFPGWPVVALVGGDAQAGQSRAHAQAQAQVHAQHNGMMISAMRAGASQIVTLPLCPEDFKAALSRVAVQFVYSARETRVIAVAGVTGGSGATSVAINLAAEIGHHHGLRCVLVDLSLRMGMVATHLNLEHSFSIIDLLRDVRRVDTLLLERVLVSVTDNFRVLAGPSALTGPLGTTIHDIGHIIDGLKQMCDVVVLDVPSLYDELYFEVLGASGQTLLIGEQKLPSIRALKLVREALGQDPGRKDFLVVNRYDAKNRDFTVERLFKPLGVPSLLTVARDDAGMAGAMAHGCPLRLVAPRSPALVDLDAIAELLLDRDSRTPARTIGLLGRLSRALTNA